MHVTATRKGLAAAGVVVMALALAACGSDAEPAPTTTAPVPTVDISLSTYGDLDYSMLAAQYEAQNAGVTVTITHAETPALQYEALTAALAEGGLGADVVAVEEAWLGDLVATPEATLDLGPLGATSRAGDFVPWALAQSTARDGTVFAVPVEVRPLALCFNGLRFEAAGFPRDRESVERLFAADWPRAVELAGLYKEATGLAMFDNGVPLWSAMARETSGGYYDDAGEVSVESNVAAQGKWKVFAAALGAGAVARSAPGDWGGGAALIDGTFAAFLCEPQRLDEVRALIEAAGGDAASGWDVADVVPGGGASAGGAYLAVDASGAAPTEAAAFALWLAQPAQQEALFASAGIYPAAVAAEAQAATLMPDDDFFAGAPVGEILRSRAGAGQARTVGPQDTYLEAQAFGPAVQGLADGTLTAEQAWAQLVAAAAVVAPVPSPRPTPSA